MWPLCREALGATLLSSPTELLCTRAVCEPRWPHIFISSFNIFFILQGSFIPAVTNSRPFLSLAREKTGCLPPEVTKPHVPWTQGGLVSLGMKLHPATCHVSCYIIIICCCLWLPPSLCSPFTLELTAEGGGLLFVFCSARSWISL